MDKIIIILIGGVLYGIFGSIVNYTIYYVGFIFKMPFDFFYWAGNLFGFSFFGPTLLTILYYSVMFYLFNRIKTIFIG